MWGNAEMVEFTEYKLGDICSRLSSGKGINKNDISDEGSYPVYGGNGLRGYTESANFDGECAIIGRQGAFCGNVRYFSGKAYMTEHAVVVCANQENNTHYLAYYLSMMNLGRLSGQSAQPGISVKTLSMQPVMLPTLDIQNKASAILNMLDRKIDLNKRINNHLEQLMKCLFNSYYKSSTEKAPFRSIINVIGGGTPKTSNETYWNGDIPFFTPKDVGSPYALTTEKYITPEGLAHCNSPLYPMNTVFVTARGTVGKVSLAGYPMAMNQSCYALTSDSVNPILVYFYTLETVNSLKHKANGGVFDAIVTRDFDHESICKLSVEEEETFLSIASPVYEKILTRCKENINLRNLRDTLLPKLMSGELDVSDLDL